MKTQRHFATCNGETVQLAKVSYAVTMDSEGRTIHNDFKMVIDFMPLKHDRYAVVTGPTRQVYTYAVGTCTRFGCGSLHFVERRIERPAHPSNHKCNARCMSAKGHTCECSCGGKNHGSN